MTSEEISEWVDSRLKALTLEEKALLTSGVDISHTQAIHRLGIPAMKLIDGPNGVRGEMFSTSRAACFPCGAALGATWDPALVEELGRAMAEEAKTKDVDIVLGPMVNIQRTPLAGRNFETYSEDPHLASRLAVAMVGGLQSSGVGACIKHYICNDQEYERMSISSEVDERTLREIYLPPFEAAVREANPVSLMASYNKFEGTYLCENLRLIQGILRDELGFEGLVVSDWGAVHSSAPTANAGLDLEMPGPPKWLAPNLAEAVRSGEVPDSTLDAMVRRILTAICLTGRIERPEETPEESVDEKGHRALIRRAAAASAVLLKNENGLLPFDPVAAAAGEFSIAVIGPNAERMAIQGGGSSAVRSHRPSSPLEAIRERAAKVDYDPGCDISRLLSDPPASLFDKVGGGRFAVEVFDNPDLAGEPVGAGETTLVSAVWNGPPRLARPDPNNTRLAPDGSVDADPKNFSARWIGTMTPAKTGDHLFEVSASGKSRLFAGGELVIDNWTSPKPGGGVLGMGSREKRGVVSLVAGEPVEIRFEYGHPDPMPVGLISLTGVHLGMAEPAESDEIASAVETARAADVALVVVGTSAEWETEGSDRADMRLPGRQDELIRRVAEVNPKTVVVLNCGSPVEMDWIRDVPAVLLTWFPGEEAGNALCDVIFGDSDPGGRLPVTFPRRYEENPTYQFYPGTGGRAVYGERLLVGYRYYDTKGVDPLFPFGHGLSYTNFDLSEISLLPSAGKGCPDGCATDLSVRVTNTGDRVGSQVVQVYVSRPDAGTGSAWEAEPEKELRAFAKVELSPGRSEVLGFHLRTRDFAKWDGEWKAIPGVYRIDVGTSSREIAAHLPFDLH